MLVLADTIVSVVLLLVAPFTNAVVPPRVNTGSSTFTVVEFTVVVVPVTVKSPVIVVVPTESVPVVLIFSFPNEIAPLESVMLPLARVKLPIVDPVAALIVDEKAPVPVTDRAPEARVPVVLRFSSPNDIAPLLSVMLPLASVRVPTVDPVAALIVDEKAPVPVTERAPGGKCTCCA